MEQLELNHAYSLLRKKAEEYRNEMGLINQFDKILRQISMGTIPDGVLFEVHFRIYWPGQTATKKSAVLLSEAYRDASSSWNELNRFHEKPARQSPDIFIRFNDYLFVLDKEDIIEILKSEIGSEALTKHKIQGHDKRLDEKLFWKADKELPVWHA